MYRKTGRKSQPLVAFICVNLRQAALNCGTLVALIVFGVKLR